MKIRSITAFAEVSYPLESGAVADLGSTLQSTRDALDKAGLEVETLRLATQPFPEALAGAGPARAADFAQDLEAVAFVHELDYIALGPVRLADPVAYLEELPDVFRHTGSVFASIEIASPAAGLSLPRIRHAGRVMDRVAGLREDGFTNLRLAALANVSAWSPFFPAAYHGGGAPRLAVATESADLAVAAITSAPSLNDARATLVEAIQLEAQRIETITRRAVDGTGIAFQGIDFSLAPFPEQARSIGTALEEIGLTAAGSAGTLLAAAFITDAIDRAEFTRTGFCGLMLPVLEDSALAHAAAEGTITVRDLLTISAVCGTGLDTIPLPGDTGAGALAAILADVAALALRLDKPLTARLMPLPGKQPGDPVEFEFEYFASGRVMAPHAAPFSGLLAGDENIVIQPISARRS